MKISINDLRQVEGFKPYHDGITKYYLNDLKAGSDMILSIDVHQDEFEGGFIELSDLEKIIARNAYVEGQKSMKELVKSNIFKIQ